MKRENYSIVVYVHDDDEHRYGVVLEELFYSSVGRERMSQLFFRLLDILEGKRGDNDE